MYFTSWYYENKKKEKKEIIVEELAQDNIVWKELLTKKHNLTFI